MADLKSGDGLCWSLPIFLYHCLVNSVHLYQQIYGLFVGVTKRIVICQFAYSNNCFIICLFVGLYHLHERHVVTNCDGVSVALALAIISNDWPTSSFGCQVFFDYWERRTSQLAVRDSQLWTAWLWFLDDLATSLQPSRTILNNSNLLKSVYNCINMYTDR